MLHERIKITIGAVIKEPGSTIKNKTGGWRTMLPVKDPKKCIECGFCWMFCPDMSYNEKLKSNPDYDFCKGCGICAQVCPTNAIVMEREKK